MASHVAAVPSSCAPSTSAPARRRAAVLPPRQATRAMRLDVMTAVAAVRVPERASSGRATSPMPAPPAALAAPPSRAASTAASTALALALLTAGPAAAADPAATAATAATATTLLRPFFALAELAFVVRIVMTWYPGVDTAARPWSLVFTPTEPLLAPTRRAVPPVGGVDVSPIIWFALTSLANEILVGPQGILVLLSRKVGGA